MPNTSFSRRHGFAETPTQARESAPQGVRVGLLQIAANFGVRPFTLRHLLCKVLRIFPDEQNWSDPNVHDEVVWLLQECAWYKVYDFVEEIHRNLLREGPNVDEDDDHLLGLPNEVVAERFQEEVNRLLADEGLSWHVVNGNLEARGDVAFESNVPQAIARLTQSGLVGAAKELSEALADISRRPEADITGAVQHAGAALECVAREVTGNASATLGAILSKHSDLLPRPLDEAAKKVWGFTSDRARHVREGHSLGAEEAELVVATAAAWILYLIKKLVQNQAGSVS